eukprot:1147432-Pelagomonas_calceolata.AAC.4
MEGRKEGRKEGREGGRRKEGRRGGRKSEKRMLPVQCTWVTIAGCHALLVSACFAMLDCCLLALANAAILCRCLYCAGHHVPSVWGEGACLLWQCCHTLPLSELYRSRCFICVGRRRLLALPVLPYFAGVRIVQAAMLYLSGERAPACFGNADILWPCLNCAGRHAPSVWGEGKERKGREGMCIAVPAYVGSLAEVKKKCNAPLALLGHRRFKVPLFCQQAALQLMQDLFEGPSTPMLPTAALHSMQGLFECT